MVISDPYAWLRAISRSLAGEGSFAELATVVQFQRLVDGATAVSEAKAAILRQSSPAVQSGLLGHLAMMEAQRPLDPSEELWRVRKDARELAASPSTCRAGSTCDYWGMATFGERPYFATGGRDTCKRMVAQADDAGWQSI